MRQKTVRLIQVVEEKGVFGKCSCGGEVLFYSDAGVRCKKCGKLYGTWFQRRKSAIKRSQENSLMKEVEESMGNAIEAYDKEDLSDLI